MQGTAFFVLLQGLCVQVLHCNMETSTVSQAEVLA